MNARGAENIIGIVVEFVYCVYFYISSLSWLLTIEFIFTLYHFKNKSLSASGARFSTHENFDNDWKYIQSLVAHIVEFKLTAAAASRSTSKQRQHAICARRRRHRRTPCTDMADVNVWLRECERVWMRMWCAHLIYAAMETDMSLEKNRNAHTAEQWGEGAHERQRLLSLLYRWLYYVYYFIHDLCANITLCVCVLLFIDREFANVFGVCINRRKAECRPIADT